MGLGKAGNGVEQEEDIVALVPEMFGGRHRAVGCPLLRARRFAGRRGDDHRLRHDGLWQHIADELVHLTRTLADQSNDDPVGLEARRQRSEKRRFADAGAGKQAEPLALADRQQRIGHHPARRQALADTAPRMGGKGGGVQPAVGCAQRNGGCRAASHVAAIVNDLAQPVVAGLHARFLLDLYGVADPDGIAWGKEQRRDAIARNAEDFSENCNTRLFNNNFISNAGQFADSGDLHHAGSDLRHGAPEPVECEGGGSGGHGHGANS